MNKMIDLIGESADEYLKKANDPYTYFRLCELTAASDGISLRNTAAILAKFPDAAEVHTMGKWAKRGQHIREGSKGTPIIKGGEYGEDPSVVYVFDVTQTQPSVNSVQAGRTRYENYKPYDDSVTKTHEFFNHLSKSVSDARFVHQRDAMGGTVEAKGSLIKIDANAEPGKQVEGALLAYFRNKISGADENAELHELKAVSAAYIAGKRFGYGFAPPTAAHNFTPEQAAEALRHAFGSAKNLCNSMIKTRQAEKTWEQGRQLNRSM